MPAWTARNSTVSTIGSARTISTDDAPRSLRAGRYEWRDLLMAVTSLSDLGGFGGDEVLDHRPRDTHCGDGEDGPQDVLDRLRHPLFGEHPLALLGKPRVQVAAYELSGDEEVEHHDGGSSHDRILGIRCCSSGSSGMARAGWRRRRSVSYNHMK